MSAATSANCSISSATAARLQQPREPGRTHRRSNGRGGAGGGGGNVKRVSWKLANMAAIATPESDDDFDVIDVGFSSPQVKLDDQRTASYHVTQDGTWILTAARDERAESVTLNGANNTYHDGEEKNSSLAGLGTERVWAVVATPTPSTAHSTSRDADPDEPNVFIERDGNVEEHVSYVVTTAFSIARPENGPQLLYQSMPGGDDHSIESEEPEPEVVARSSAVTSSAIHDQHFSGNDRLSLSSTMADCATIDESSSADSGFGTTVNSDVRLVSRSDFQSTIDEVEYRISNVVGEIGQRRPISTMTTNAMGSEIDQSEVVPVPRRLISLKHFVVVAIDFGTALSGYAFGFVRDPGRSVHMMRRWEGGDPGVVNQKTPTALLLDPEGKFHSFGCAARDFYHDLDDDESRTWMYFDRFKMALHHDQVCTLIQYLFIHVHLNSVPNYI